MQIDGFWDMNAQHKYSRDCSIFILRCRTLLNSLSELTDNTKNKMSYQFNLITQAATPDLSTVTIDLITNLIFCSS